MEFDLDLYSKNELYVNSLKNTLKFDYIVDWDMYGDGDAFFDEFVKEENRVPVVVSNDKFDEFKNAAFELKIDVVVDKLFWHSGAWYEGCEDYTMAWLYLDD